MTKEERLSCIEKIKKNMEDDCLFYSKLYMFNIKMLVKNEKLNDRDTREQLLELLYELNAVYYLEKNSRRSDFLMEKTPDNQWVISDDELKEIESDRLIQEYAYSSGRGASKIQYLDIYQLIHAIRDPSSPKNV